ncbi:O-unit flippase-like protein [Pedobacter sp. BMA]|uniref:O-unit flippase-like protein n=1 Tax=Pedobacter sp. BMA TaxID=1663685 RepID=UPI000A8CE3A7|nr:O-unit flippase-like protein [Pedobacter sp. BMA]
MFYQLLTSTEFTFMDISISKKDVFWSYVAQALNYGSSVLLLPIILKTLPEHQIGIWYIFSSITSLVLLLDFGFLPNITRIVSYVYSGAQKLKKEGLDDITTSNEINYDLLKTIIHVIKKIYMLITGLLVFLLIFGGYWYLRNIISPEEHTLWIAFYIFCIAISMNFFYSYYDALLLGRGKVKNANQAISYAKLLNLILAATGLFLGYGLLSISIALLLSNIVCRFLYHRAFYDFDTVTKLDRANVENPKDVFNSIWFNSKKLGLVSVGTFLIFQANMLIAGQFFSLSEVASYGLVVQLFSLLAIFSRLYFTSHLPRFNSLWMGNNVSKLKGEFIKSMKIGWALYALGSLVIIFAGRYILQIIGSNTNLPNLSMILMFGFIYLMEITHGNSGIFLTTKNTVPYVLPTIVSGVAIFCANLILIFYFHLRLEAFGISTIFIQLSYNAWKWPLEVIKELKIKFKDLYA